MKRGVVGYTYCDMPRHVMLAREGDCVKSLHRVYDINEPPDRANRPVRKYPGTQGARQPPEMAVRVRRHARGVDQEE